MNGRFDGMDCSGQTSADGERSGSDYNHTPGTAQVSAASSSSQQVASNWTKRERDGALEEARKCPKAPAEPDVLSSLDEQQRTVLAQLVKCVDADSSVVITNPLLKGGPLRRLTPLGRARGCQRDGSRRFQPVGPRVAPRLPGGGGRLGSRRVWQPRGASASPRGSQRLHACVRGSVCRASAGGCSLASLLTCGPSRSCADNPIVYVTEPWQCMCGYSEAEALGRNPRITQGSRTDPKVVQLLSSALSKQSACKVQFVNYRGGRVNEPFWNMLSISPVLYQGNVLFYMANLQDYSYHMSKMVSLTPGQFCRAAVHHQRGRRLQPMDAQLRAKPAIIEADDTFALPTPTSSEVLAQGGFVMSTPQPIKRLGWNNLTLEPEHLTERLKDALQGMGATYEVHERAAADGEIFMLHAKLDNVACRMTVSEDPDNGSQRISVTRLAGDTFLYHDAFRLLRQHLGDACTHVLLGADAASSSGGAGAALKRSIGLKLAPEPPAIVEVTQPAADVAAS